MKSFLKEKLQGSLGARTDCRQTLSRGKQAPFHLHSLLWRLSKAAVAIYIPKRARLRTAVGETRCRKAAELAADVRALRSHVNTKSADDLWLVCLVNVYTASVYV